MKPSFLLVATACVVGMAACSAPSAGSARDVAQLAGIGQGPPATAAPAPTSAASISILSNPRMVDPPVTSLREQPPKSEALRLAAEAAQVIGLCDLDTLLHQVPEPALDRPADVLTYAIRQHSLFVGFDPRAKLSYGGGREAPAPREVLNAVAVERAQTFAFLARIQTLVAARKAGQISEQRERELIARAVVILGSEDFTRAESVISSFADTACSS